MTNPTITVGEAINLINNSILDFQDGLSQDTINTITFAVNNEIQVRDYFLGMPETYSLDTCLSFVKYLGSSVDENECYALATIASAYEYENGNLFSVAMLIAGVLDMKPDYSLAKLIDRVAEAGWPAESFAEMRKELHPKVIEQITEIADQVILVEQ